jgi:hypothetical protein
MRRVSLLIMIVLSGCGGAHATAATAKKPRAPSLDTLAVTRPAQMPDDEALCEIAKKMHESTQPIDFNGQPICDEAEAPDKDTPAHLEDPPEPYRTVKIVDAGWSGDEGVAHHRLFLVLQTTAGWYYALLGELENPGGLGGRPLDLQPAGLAFAHVGDGAPAVVASIANVRNGCEHDEQWCAADRAVVTTICGVGPDGVPSCTAPMTLSSRWQDTDASVEQNKVDTGSWSLRLGYPGHDEIDITSGAGESKLPDEAQKLVGRHRFAP